MEILGRPEVRLLAHILGIVVLPHQVAREVVRVIQVGKHLRLEPLDGTDGVLPRGYPRVDRGGDLNIPAGMAGRKPGIREGGLGSSRRPPNVTSPERIRCRSQCSPLLPTWAPCRAQ